MVILTGLISGADFEFASVDVESLLCGGCLAANLSTKYGLDIRDRLIEMLFSFPRRYEATSAKLFAFVLAPVSVARLTLRFVRVEVWISLLRHRGPSSSSRRLYSYWWLLHTFYFQLPFCKCLYFIKKVAVDPSVLYTSEHVCASFTGADG